MILYELAIEMGERSSEVADRARSLGLADAGPATELTAAQEAAIRAGVAVPPAVGSVTGTPDTVDLGPAPMTWQTEGSTPSSAPPPPGPATSRQSSLPPPMATPGAGPSPPPPAPRSVAPRLAPGHSGPTAPAPTTSPSPSRSSKGGRSALGAVLVPLGIVVVAVMGVLLTWQFFRNARSNSDQVREAVQPVAVADGSQDAPVEQCRSLDPADPTSLRLVRVCAALEPPGTPLAAAASAALSKGGLEAYTTPDPGRFCPAADQALSLVDAGGTPWEARRSVLLADRANVRASLATIVAVSPPRWVSSLDTYASSMQGQLDALGPDSVLNSWDVSAVSASKGASSPVEELRIARALSCG